MDMTSTLAKYGLTCENANFAVIAKPKGELIRVLKCLRSRGVTVLLIDPPDEKFSFGVESLLGHAHYGKEDLSQGEEECKEDQEDLYPYPYAYTYTSNVEEEEEEDPSKILDFLEPIRLVKEDMTAVFWDGEDCPFPLGSTPDAIYKSIASALVERHFTDNITIWAYLDDDKKGSWRDDLLVDNKTWDSRIYFLPGGDKDSRRIRMANDIIFLLNTGRPRNLVLASDQFIADLFYLELLRLLYSDIVFIEPTQDINKPESPEWPGLLIDEGWLQFTSNIRKFSDEPFPKERAVSNYECRG
ncbi:unnamed protein product [Eruca vesicaria subsp. sativa]|uniref:NYN domain-containing protein n=1 Tax=Eruca vesicaria subsp. sativa TaxID=29727 RepID=A0ABC8KYV2_ERUVS|nr:unnamed protein product [Eruca vesicaria subsp. sativa]